MAGGPPLRRLSQQRVRVYTLDPHVRRLQHPGLQTSRQRCRFVAGRTPQVSVSGAGREVTTHPVGGVAQGRSWCHPGACRSSVENARCATQCSLAHARRDSGRTREIRTVPGEGPWPGLWERHGKEAPRTPQTDSPAFPLPRKARSSPGFSGPRPPSRVTGPCGPGPLDLQSCPSEWDQGTLRWDDNSRYRAFQAPGPSCPRPLCEDRKCRAALRP